MNNNRSVATIDYPEFIDIKPFNPLISECQIKVLYLGRNRNGSFIDKNTAIQMANSLPGCPIVGAWREDIQDFGDHGHVMTIEDNEIKFSCKTRPYGFVAPDARVWFQKYVDTDEFGEEIEREYMMTTGYLWTGQYEEAMSVVEEGKGQSMELDEPSLQGHWAKDNKTGMDFFIINDAIFSKLCILGDEVEPCFEGASIESSYTTNAEFTHSLFTMMKQLQETLEQSKGGLNMPKDFIVSNSEEVQEQSEVAETVEEQAAEVVDEHEPAAESEESAEESQEEDEVDVEDADAETIDVESESEDESSDDADTDFVAKKEDETEEAPAAEEEPAEEEPTAKEEPAEDEKKEKKVSENACGDKKKYSFTEEEFAVIQSELESLRAFKLSIENKEKDALIDKYYMLSDEDKADIVAHKEEYTLEQIEEKLALVYVKNNVDFSTVDGHKEQEGTEVDSLLNFSLDDSDSAEVVSDMQAAFRELGL